MGVKCVYKERPAGSLAVWTGVNKRLEGIKNIGCVN